MQGWGRGELFTMDFVWSNSKEVLKGKRTIGIKIMIRVLNRLISSIFKVLQKKSPRLCNIQRFSRKWCIKCSSKK